MTITRMTIRIGRRSANAPGLPSVPGSRLRRAAGVCAGLLLGMLLALSWVAPRASAAELQTFAKDHLTIETASGQRYPFDIELAVTPLERAQGLMYRKQLAPDAGMLFLFDRMAPRTFWMKNTYLPLDIIFLDDHGRIVSIAKHTTPLTETPIPSGKPAMGVLEVNAGTADRLGLKPGDRIIYRAFGS